MWFPSLIDWNFTDGFKQLKPHSPVPQPLDSCVNWGVWPRGIQALCVCLCVCVTAGSKLTNRNQNPGLSPQSLSLSVAPVLTSKVLQQWSWPEPAPDLHTCPSFSPFTFNSSEKTLSGSLSQTGSVCVCVCESFIRTILDKDSRVWAKFRIEELVPFQFTRTKFELNWWNVIQVWNDMRESKWLLINFWINYPWKI